MGELYNIIKDFESLIKNFSKGKMDNNRDKFKYSKSLFDSLIFTISRLKLDILMSNVYECEMAFFFESSNYP